MSSSYHFLSWAFYGRVAVGCRNTEVEVQRVTGFFSVQLQAPSTVSVRSLTRLQEVYPPHVTVSLALPSKHIAPLRGAPRGT